MAIKRYDPEVLEAHTRIEDDYAAQMEVGSHGDYVLASDYDDLLKIKHELTEAMGILIKTGHFSNVDHPLSVCTCDYCAIVRIFHRSEAFDATH